MGASCSTDTLKNVASKGEDVVVRLTEHKEAVLETFEALHVPEKGIVGIATGFAVIEGVEAMKGTPVK